MDFLKAANYNSPYTYEKEKNLMKILYRNNILVYSPQNTQLCIPQYTNASEMLLEMTIKFVITNFVFTILNSELSKIDYVYSQRCLFDSVPVSRKLMCYTSLKVTDEGEFYV